MAHLLMVGQVLDPENKVRPMVWLKYDSKRIELERVVDDKGTVTYKIKELSQDKQPV